MKRQYYIDNLRWICIVLLLPFHAAMSWNTWESNYIHFQGNKLVSSIVIMISPYYMPLLFVLAGMSMNFALRKRGNRQFIVERIKKLLIPMISGVLTVVAVMTYFADRYFNQYQEGFFTHYKKFLTKVGDLTGYDGKFTPAHLWFLLFLFIVSLLAFVIVNIQHKYWPTLSLRDWNIGKILLVYIVVLALTKVFDFGGKSIGESFALVMIGYYLFSEEEVIERITKYRYIFLGLTFICCLICTVVFVWFGEHESYCYIICNRIAEWFGILAVLGLGKSLLDRSNRFTKFMSERSFLIYIFHFVWLIVLQYYLSKISTSIIFLYTTSVIGAFGFTLLTIELIRRIPVIRSLFGIKKKQK